MSDDSWLTAAKVADRWEGATPTRVTQMVTLLGLRGSTQHTIAADGRTEYSPSAVALTERELQSRGYSRSLKTSATFDAQPVVIKTSRT